MYINEIKFEENAVYGFIYDYSQNPSKSSIIEVKDEEVIFHENADISSSWRDEYYIKQKENYSKRPATQEEIEAVLRKAILKIGYTVSKSLK